MHAEVHANEFRSVTSCCCYAGMTIKDEEAALQAISDNVQDEKERIQMLLLFKGMLPDKRRDFWHGLTPKDLVGMLRSLLESGGLGNRHVFNICPCSENQHGNALQMRIISHCSIFFYMCW